MDSLCTQLVVYAGEAIIDIVAQVVQLAVSVGVGIAQLDFCLQLCNTSVLLGVIPGNVRVLMARSVSSAKDVAKTSIQYTQCSTGNRIYPLLPMVLTIS